MDDATDAGYVGRLDNRPHRFRVDRAILARGKSGLPIDGGDMVDDLRAGRGTLDRGAVANVSLNEGDAACLEVACPRGIANERGHLVTMPRKSAGEMPARESARPGDYDAQRSATTVTGDPTTAVSPARDSARSTREVKVTDATRL
jgi:hypothetical protein